jgi:hypothetical protein
MNSRANSSLILHHSNCRVISITQKEKKMAYVFLSTEYERKCYHKKVKMNFDKVFYKYQICEIVI